MACSLGPGHHSQSSILIISVVSALQEGLLVVHSTEQVFYMLETMSKIQVNHIGANNIYI